MKKMVMILFAALLCLSLCACSEETGTEASSSEESGLIDAGVMSGDEDWGPVIGLD